MERYTTTVQPGELEQVDWGRASLSLGVRLKNGEEQRWLGFTEEELRVLSALLDRQVVEGVSASGEYEAIFKLSAALKSMCSWAKKNEEKVG